MIVERIMCVLFKIFPLVSRLKAHRPQGFLVGDLLFLQVGLKVPFRREVIFLSRD